MIREEEIRKAADHYEVTTHLQPLGNAFANGARWADANPSPELCQKVVEIADNILPSNVTKEAILQWFPTAEAYYSAVAEEVRKKLNQPSDKEERI